MKTVQESHKIDEISLFLLCFLQLLLAFNFQLLVSDVHPSDIAAKTFILRVLFFPVLSNVLKVGKNWKETKEVGMPAAQRRAGAG